MKKSPLTARSFAVGTAGLIIITASSMYVALKMGALPWPTVFVTVLSAAILGRAKNSSLEEINCTHTLMSAGAMVAGGLAFTLPGLWMMSPDAVLPVKSIIAIALAGAILGTLFTVVFRKTLIEKENLPYPMGMASYNTLIACKEGKGAKELFSSMGFAAVFTLLRDQLALIPSALVLYSGGAVVPPLIMWFSPMAVGVGAIIGPALALMWFGGTILGHFIITPVGILTGFFSGMEDATLFRESLGIGLMIGTGLGIAIKAIISLFRKSGAGKQSGLSRKSILLIIIGALLCAILLTLLTEITLPESLLLLVGVYLTAYLSGMLTGQTGINPMEIFGILVLLAVSLIMKPTFTAAFSVAAVVAVACGLTGDVMNDLKSGSMVGTKAKYQLIAEGVGGIIGALIAALSLIALRKAYGNFGSSLFPAPQAAAVSKMVSGISNVPAFVIGIAIGVLLFLLKLPSATLGLGVYLPTTMSSTMALGAVIYAIAKKYIKNKSLVETETSLLSSGFLGGEGIMGVLIAIFALVKGL